MAVLNRVEESPSSKKIRDKKMNFLTLKTMLDRLDEEKYYSEFVTQLLTECELQIRSRKVRRTYRQKLNYPILNIFQQYYAKQYSKLTLKNLTTYTAQFVFFLENQFPEVTSLATKKECITHIKKHMISAYEDYLSKKISNKQLKKRTVELYLGSMRTFLKMLYGNQHSSIRKLTPMITKFKEATKTNSLESLDKKKINLETLLSAIKRVDEKNCFNEFSNKLVKEFEKHIPNRNKKYSSKLKKLKKLKNINPLMTKFHDFYIKRFAKSTLNTHSSQAELFLNFIVKNYFEVSTIEDCKMLNKQMVADYEEHLVTRIYLDEIQKCTVNDYLYSMKLLLEMLSTLKINNVFYFIPESLRANGKRSNEYVNLDEVLQIVKFIEQSKSRFKIRNICIILLITELGCRPNEIASLCIEDIRLSEHLITLRSVKSKSRTLTLSKDLTNVIHSYLDKRILILSENNELFLNGFNQPINTGFISSLFHYMNIKTFGEKRFTAKALRHTFATNALDNQNDFDQVSESLGHKHRRSTEWYIHRSVQRLLSRSLPHNPLNEISEV